MIPSTFLGLVLFVASLGPGYVFIATAEKYRPRRDQSQLGEAVQMAIIGALASSAAALAVLATGIIDREELVQREGQFLLLHPLSGLGALFLFLLIGYAGAWVAARAWCAGLPKTRHPDSKGWQLAFTEGRSSKHDVTVLTVEMSDGRRVVGKLGQFTGTPGDDRELVLVSQIAARAGPGAPLQRLSDEFLVLRESEIRAVSGRYLSGRKPGADDRGWWLSRLLRFRRRRNG